MTAPPRRPQSVLFLCERNATRSRLAEAVARHHFGARLYIASAGVRPGPPDPFVAAVLDEAGIAPSATTATPFDDLDDVAFDLIVTLSPLAHHRAMELTRTHAVEVEYWPTFDPTAVEGSREQRLDAYRGVLAALTAHILERLR
jgi:protein-tyrosine-phosphatase